MNDYVLYSVWLDAIMGDLDLLTDPIRCLLTTLDYEPDESHATISDVSGEVQGKGYVRGGRLLEGKSVAGGVFRAANPVWSNATIRDAARAVVYRATDGLLICCLALDEPTSSKNRDFELIWRPEGIVDIRRAMAGV